MTGTQNHEGIASLVPAVNYLAQLPRPSDLKLLDQGNRLPQQSSRSWQIHCGLAILQAYEAHLAARLLQALAERPRFQVWGITDPNRLDQRVPTVSITMEDRSPEEMAQHLAARQIYAWHGNMYAIGLTERLGLEERGGFLRIGIVHYNTAEEIDRLVKALDEL
jgi:selenocysteine lyase/cysteine desulfurase